MNKVTSEFIYKMVNSYKAAIRVANNAL